MSAEAVRQKANRYRSHADVENVPVIAPKNVAEPIDPPEEATAQPDQTDSVGSAKGNRFKSKPGAASARKGAGRSLPSAIRKQSTPPTGVKIVFLDETMRDEYLQIAGYLMLNFRVKLTMTAYFCFLHDQAVARQSDPAFLTALAQFARPTIDPSH